MPKSRSARYAKWGATLFLCVTLALVALILQGDFRQQQKWEAEQAGNLSQLLSERLVTGLNEASLILQSNSQLLLVQKLLEDHQLSLAQQQALTLMLKERVRMAPYLTEISIVDQGCQVVISSAPLQKQQPSHEEFCRWLRRDDKRDNPSATAQYNQQRDRLLLANKLHDLQGRVVGLAVGRIDNARLEQEVGKLVAGKHAEILVMDQRSNLVARWPQLPAEQRLHNYRPPQLGVPLQREGAQLLFRVASSVDGVDRQYSLRTLGDYPLRVIVGLSHEDVTISLWQRALLAAATWTFTALLTMLALRSHLAKLEQNHLLQRSAARLRVNEERLRLVLDTAPLALLLVNPLSHRIQHANAPARALLKLPQREQSGDADIHNLPFHLQPVEQWLEQQEGMHEREVELEFEDRSRQWAMVSMQPLDGSEPPSTLIAFYDISTRKELEHKLQESNRQLSEMAATDPLTHLSNRRHADQALKDEVSRCERYGQAMSIAVFDIDHFKKFNDRYGHQAGDNVLVAVANAMRDSTRNLDVCARIGGEEFLVIFPNTRLRDAQKVMERIQTMLAATSFPKIEQRVTFSGGLTGWQPGDTPSQMLSRADKLLYEAKAAGREQVFADPDAH